MDGDTQMMIAGEPVCADCDSGDHGNHVANLGDICIGCACDFRHDPPAPLEPAWQSPLMDDLLGTPAPWLAYRSGEQWCIRSVPAECGVARIDVARVGHTSPVDRRDALLIAAAPELYEALRTCRAELRNYERNDCGDRNASAQEAIGEADAAIAKAEGR